MDRIAEIVALQDSADTPAAEASARKWAEARLIWEEHEQSTFQAISDAIRATGRERGWSLAYLSRMERTWRYFIVNNGVQYATFADLGDFGEAYHSDWIQKGAPDRDRRSPREPSRSSRSTRATAQDDTSGTAQDAEDIHDWVRIATVYATAIAGASARDRASLDPGELAPLAAALARLAPLTAKAA